MHRIVALTAPLSAGADTVRAFDNHARFILTLLIEN